MSIKLDVKQLGHLDHGLWEMRKELDPSRISSSKNHSICSRTFAKLLNRWIFLSGAMTGTTRS